jgi:DNA-binding NarL/FixJ family response regulator
MTKKRVLLADDNAVARSMVRQLFDAHPDFEVVGAADNGREAVEKAKSLKPDLVVLDLSMPIMNGLEAAPLLRKALPDMRLILFTVHEGSEVDRLAREAGIDVVVSKNQGASKLIPQAQAMVGWVEQAYPLPKAANDC